MRIVIVGDGKIGSALAEQLSREGHEITIVDRSGTPLQRTVEDLDILSVEGNGATYATQMEAGVDEADLVIAVTAQDELNLLCCLVAKKIGARHTIARVRNPEYAGELSLISDDLGLSLSVNPELICATEMARTLRTPSAIKTDTFFGGKVELLKFQLPADSPLSGKTLMELPSVTKAKVLVCAVERGEQEIHIPSGGFRLQSGDRISFVASYGGAQQFFRQMKLAAGRVRSVMLIGGGRIAYYLARQLIEAGLDVKILESDQARCEELSIALPKAGILCGDGTNEAFLRKCGIETTDAVAALTGIDEENVLIGMYIRKTWPKIKVITKVNRDLVPVHHRQYGPRQRLQSPQLRVEPHLPLCPRHAEFREQLADRDALQACRRQGRGAGIPCVGGLEALRRAAAGAAAARKPADRLHRPRRKDHHPQRPGYHRAGRQRHRRDLQRGARQAGGHSGKRAGP